VRQLPETFARDALEGRQHREVVDARMLNHATTGVISHRCLFGAKQPAPAALEGCLESDQGRHKDVCLARLDLLDGADVQFDKFGQPLLRHLLAHSLAADIRAEHFELLLLGL